MKFFVRIETAYNSNPLFSGSVIGNKYITGCSQSRDYAEKNWGLGGYSAVYADNSHEVREEAERSGLMT